MMKALSSKFTAINGIVYMVDITLLIIWLGAAQTLIFATEFVGRKAVLVRILGMTVAIMDWFYIFSGRSGGKQIVAASVLDRIIFEFSKSGYFPIKNIPADSFLINYISTKVDSLKYIYSLQRC